LVTEPFCAKALDIQNWLDEAIRQSVSMPSLDQKIAALEEQLQRLKQQHRHSEARRSDLIGAVVLARVQHGKLEELLLRGWLEAGLSDVEDRKLFGL
jgi:hypothetical protein